MWSLGCACGVRLRSHAGADVRLEARVELLHGDVKGVGGAVQSLDRQLHCLQKRAQIGVITGHRIESRQAIEDAPAPLRQVGRGGSRIQPPGGAGRAGGRPAAGRGMAHGPKRSERRKGNAEGASDRPRWSAGRAEPAFEAEALPRPESRRSWRPSDSFWDAAEWPVPQRGACLGRSSTRGPCGE
ncbi:hypothetical protein Emag_007852 [Eimeria magna]